MQVFIPTPLRSYTIQPCVEAQGRNLGALLTDLDRSYPGIRFRMVDEQQQIRRHIRIFVNGSQIFDLAHGLRPTDEVYVVQALSGG
jgi:sulfur-carrier protein